MQSISRNDSRENLRFILDLGEDGDGSLRLIAAADRVIVGVAVEELALTIVIEKEVLQLRRCIGGIWMRGWSAPGCKASCDEDGEEEEDEMPWFHHPMENHPIIK